VTNEEYIVNSAIRGDQNAFSQLYDLYFDRIYKYMYFRMKNQPEAEDLTQEVFIKALKGIGSYKVGPTPFSSWLYRIAHNQVIDHVRKNEKRQLTSLDEVADIRSDDDPVADTEYQMQIDELTEAIAKLPAAQQEVISLRFIAGLPIAEVAKIAGKSEGTVKALQFNATASLKKLMVGKQNGKPVRENI
jgi:RNA polymerase sigma-70 factor, ECF subfamily